MACRRALRKLVPLVPKDKVMIETDCPFMSPDGSRSRNEPANLTYVLETISQLWGVAVDTAAEQITRNTREFFSLPAE